MLRPVTAAILVPQATGRGRCREHRISVLSTKTAGLSTAIKPLQVELAAEMAKSRVDLRFGLERGRAIFDALHKQARTSLCRHVINAQPLVVLTAPLIYTLSFAEFGDAETYRRAIAASAWEDNAPTQTRTYL